MHSHIHMHWLVLPRHKTDKFIRQGIKKPWDKQHNITYFSLFLITYSICYHHLRKTPKNTSWRANFLLSFSFTEVEKKIIAEVTRKNGVFLIFPEKSCERRRKWKCSSFLDCFFAACQSHFNFKMFFVHDEYRICIRCVFCSVLLYER